MPVIVNDLEVVTDKQGAPQPASGGESAAPDGGAAHAQPALGAEEVFELLRHEAERTLRLCDC
jgi:hypothetical protein